MRIRIAMLLSCLVFCPMATAQILFDSTLNSTPDDQGWPFIADPLFGHSVTQVAADGGTVLDTLNPISDRGGYFSSDPLFGIFNLPNAPQLDRHAGFAVEFSLRVEAENHTAGPAGDDNDDGVADRAGFSVIAIASDLRGIELSFWEGSIWVQEDDRSGMASMFTQAESVTYDTRASMTAYQLQVLGDRYRLLANETLLPILSGRVRDYRNFGGALDPYEIEDFLFFGDNTTRGESRVELGSIAVGEIAPACREIDTIVSDVAAKTHNMRSDLTLDGVVDQQDIARWQTIAGEFFQPAAGPFQPGDANLDGSVDGSDFNIWNDHRLVNNAGWCGGDFDADGLTDAADFAIWQAGAFGRDPVTANVPEPNGQLVLLLLVLGVARVRWAVVRDRLR